MKFINTPNYQLRKIILFTVLGFITGWVWYRVYYDFFYSSTTPKTIQSLPKQEIVVYLNTDTIQQQKSHSP